MHSADTAWACVRDRLTTELGADIWASHFAALHPVSLADGVLLLSTSDELVGLMSQARYHALLDYCLQVAGIDAQVSISIEGGPPTAVHAARQRASRMRQRLAEYDRIVARLAPHYTAASLSSYDVGYDAHSAARAACLGRVTQWGRAHADAGVGCHGAARVLVLAGGVGSGKTHLAWGVMRGLYATGWSIHAINVSDYVAATRAYSALPDPRPDALDADVLLWDDLGVQSGTEHAVRELYALANSRYERGRVDIITSNAGALAGGDSLSFFRSMIPTPPEQAAQAVRVADRLREGAEVVLFAGASAGRLVPIPSWRGLTKGAK